jgi:tRNA threonylcarbamoyl adenosine modification protein YjeE
VTTANHIAVTTSSVARTRSLGRRMAKLLRAGDVVLLQGQLGAGKTSLAQGIGAGLKVDDPVTSPSYVLLAQHSGPTPLYHADLYRLIEPDEVRELALVEQAIDGVLLIEWPERAADALPAEHLLVALDVAEDGPDHRRITIVANGERYRRVLDGLNARG